MDLRRAGSRDIVAVDGGENQKSSLLSVMAQVSLRPFRPLETSADGCLGPSTGMARTVDRCLCMQVLLHYWFV